MNQVIGEVLPLALAVLISPLPIAAEILLLFSDKPKPNAAAYVTGFLLGVGAALGLFTLLATTTDVGTSGDSAGWTSWLKIVLGAALVFGGIRRFRNRPAPGEAETPRWMSGIEAFSPPRSLVVCLGIGALNPKNIIVGLAAGVAIAEAALPVGQEVGVVIAYAVFATLGVLAPLVVAVAMGSRSEALLKGWRVWLFDNNAAVVAVIFLIIGAVLIGKGIATV